MTDQPSPAPASGDISPEIDEMVKLSHALEQLDRAELLISKNKFNTYILNDFVLKGPYGQEEIRRTLRDVDSRKLLQYMPIRLQYLAETTQNYLRNMQTRSDTVVHMTDILLAIFPEEEFRHGLFRMTLGAQGQLNDMDQRLRSLQEIFNGPAFHGATKFADHRARLGDTFDTFRDTIGYADAMPLQNRLPMLRDTYAQLADLSVSQVQSQKIIAQECLAVSATSTLLREVFKVGAANLPSSEAFRSVGSFALITGMIDMEYVTALRSAIYLINQTERPHFPTGPFFNGL